MILTELYLNIIYIKKINFTKKNLLIINYFNNVKYVSKNKKVI